MKKVMIIHPDLGIGGAERLIVDLAVALKQNGNYSIKMVTAHHDKSHCFEETRDGTLDVQCVCDWIPRSIFGYFYALCAYIRMICAALYVVLFNQDIDLIICDQISACIPFIKLFSYAKIIFYCHFPDQLLTARDSYLKKIYRAPIDWLEEKSTGLADAILVNSQFTGEVFKNTFKSLREKQLIVLYPSHIPTKKVVENSEDVMTKFNIDVNKYRHIFLSINRYERKKNIALAIQSLADLKDNVSSSDWESIYLVIAGGYDSRVLENKEYHLELESLSKSLEVTGKISFIRSFNDDEKQILLNSCSCLIYTPDKEHFGIVPIEAMQAEKPVIAVRSGGPKETVLDGETGFLCEPNKGEFSAAMKKIIQDSIRTLEMGANGKKHVEKNFSFQSFQSKLHNIVTGILE